MSEITWYLSFVDWLILLSTIVSSSIQAVAKGVANFSFFTTAYIVFHCVNVPQIFNHLSTNRHWGSFQILAIINNAAVNIGVHIVF